VCVCLVQVYLTLLLLINVSVSFCDVRNYQIVRKVGDVVAYNCVGNADSPLISSRSSSPGSSESDLESAAGKAAPFLCPNCPFVGNCHRKIQQHCIVVHHAKWQGEALPLQWIKLHKRGVLHSLSAVVELVDFIVWISVMPRNRHLSKNWREHKTRLDCRWVAGHWVVRR